MSDLVRFSHKSASARLVVWGPYDATLSNVISTDRGKGHATRLLEKVMDYADRHELSVVLLVQAFQYADKMSPDNAGLARWYRKFGFEDCEDDNVLRRMIRHPQEIHSP